MKRTGRGLFLDLFAGGGGFSTGTAEAIHSSGRHIDVAVNHDESAIVLHQANHPKTQHYLQSVYDIEPMKLVADEKGKINNCIELLVLSPDCTHHSRASGTSINRSVEIRSLAWNLINYCILPEEAKPRVIILENVSEFKSWGPLDENGSPIKEKAGANFRSFVTALRALGYKVEWNELAACDYGAATTRERFFLIARCDDQPIMWPKKSHAPAESQCVMNGEKKPYKTAGEIIDWKLPCYPVEGRTKPLADNTLRRIANGIKKYVINDEVFFVPGSNKKQAGFIISYYTETRENEARGLTLRQPLATITAKGNRFGLVTIDLEMTNLKVTETASLPNSYGLKKIGDTVFNIVNPKLRMLEPRELFNAQGFPVDYIIDGKLTLKQLANRGLSERVFVKEKIEEIKSRRSAKEKDIMLHETFMQLDLFSAGIFNASEGANVKVFHSYSKREQVARCGNSVSPPVAKALVSANLPEYSQNHIEEKEKDLADAI